ncbi:Mitotic spindle assembly checkpoint protein MAD2A [Echinococcus granulosus]|uniref:Mitotic spindle assembly checkpoint protein MAD2A n=1 Tax=Echinococcus granulosus TaxID=6210 RepID=W6UVA2_ECHGR|nr:Mitotic spindle assembly checkpoint protein MAD2A [Echinococcus granulosus]EUB62327.1 Mitotic spindle assembly checkpoint protein MAD2A [Echinococcus granulosus]
MALQKLQTSNAIDLKGSVEVIADYFYVAINNILYIRGVYPEASFKQVKKFGRSVLMTTDEELIDFLNCLVKQMKVWLSSDSLKRLVLVIKSAKTEEVLERWQFNVVKEEESSSVEPKSMDQVNNELSVIIRQIVSSSTFLPVLSSSCTFNLLVYTDINTEIPEGWDETGPCFVPNSTHVQLRSFSTRIHKPLLVDNSAAVAWRRWWSSAGVASGGVQPLISSLDRHMSRFRKQFWKKVITEILLSLNDYFEGLHRPKDLCEVVRDVLILGLCVFFTFVVTLALSLSAKAPALFSVAFFTDDALWRVTAFPPPGSAGQRCWIDRSSDPHWLLRWLISSPSPLFTCLGSCGERWNYDGHPHVTYP